MKCNFELKLTKLWDDFNVNLFLSLPRTCSSDLRSADYLEHRSVGSPFLPSWPKESPVSKRTYPLALIDNRNCIADPDISQVIFESNFSNKKRLKLYQIIDGLLQIDDRLLKHTIGSFKAPEKTQLNNDWNKNHKKPLKIWCQF